jgi:fructokinase
MRILGIGEILWDLLPDGPRLGGAPFNVTAHLERFGHDVRFATAVGDDALGERTLDALRERGIGLELVQVITGARTGTASVEIDEAGVPRFDIATDAAYEAFRLEDAALRETIRWGPDALVYGTLAQRSASVRDATRRLVGAMPASIRLYDVNLRVGGWDAELLGELASMATVLKLNRDEVDALAGLGWGPSSSREAFARGVANGFGLQAVCITLGGDGSALLLGDRYREAGAPRVDVVDTVGSGDAFAAALLDGLLAGRDDDGLLIRANALGALVASRPGAIPDWSPDELTALEASVGR